MIGRIVQQRLELFWIIRGSIFGDPKSTGSKLVESQHIHHTHRWQTGTKQFRTLGHHRTDQQSPIATTLNREPLGPRIFLLNQPLGSSNEVVKYVLFLFALAGEVPVFPIFAPTTEIGNRHDSAHLHPGKPAH